MKILTMMHFFGCTNLQYNVSNGFKYLGDLFNPFYYLVGNDNDITPNTLHDDCFVLTSCATYANTYISTLKIPSQITHIGSFRDCVNLESVEFNSRVEKIVEFVHCSKLSSFIFPSNVNLKEIAGYSFASDFELETFWIPESVIYIGSDAFDTETMSPLQTKTIYCFADEKPDGWDSDWHRKGVYGAYHNVVWGCKENPFL